MVAQLLCFDKLNMEFEPIDLSKLRQSLHDAVKSDYAGVENEPKHTLEFFDKLCQSVLSRLHTIETCKSMMSVAEDQVQHLRHQEQMTGDHINLLENRLARQCRLQQYMRAQIDRRDAVLAEQRKEFYQQLLVLKELVIERDIDRVLLSEQLQGVALNKFEADHRLELRRKGSLTQLAGDQDALEFAAKITELEERLQMQKTQAAAHVESLNKEIDTSNSNLREQRSLVKRLQTSLAEANQTIETVQTENSEHIESMSKLQQEHQVLQSDADRFTSQCKQLMEQVAEITSQLAVAKVAHTNEQALRATINQMAAEATERENMQ